jgi:hypothetical protein
MKLKIITKKNKYIKFFYLSLGIFIILVSSYGLIIDKEIDFITIFNFLFGLAVLAYFFRKNKKDKLNNTEEYIIDCLNFNVIEA